MNDTCTEDIKNKIGLFGLSGLRLAAKKFRNASIMFFIQELLQTHDVADYQTSEETESGVIGVHIVFERKKEV